MWQIDGPYTKDDLRPDRLVRLMDRIAVVTFGLALLGLLAAYIMERAAAR